MLHDWRRQYEKKEKSKAFGKNVQKNLEVRGKGRIFATNINNHNSF